MAETASTERVAALIDRFWSALERFRPEEALAMLTEDVNYDGAIKCTSRAAVAVELEKRSRSRVVRHLITNLVTEPLESGVAVSYLLTAFGHVAAEGETPPYPASVPNVVADVTMTVVEKDGELQIGSLNSDQQFRLAH